MRVPLTGTSAAPSNAPFPVRRPGRPTSRWTSPENPVMRSRRRQASPAQGLNGTTHTPPNEPGPPRRRTDRTTPRPPGRTRRNTSQPNTTPDHGAARRRQATAPRAVPEDPPGSDRGSAATETQRQTPRHTSRHTTSNTPPTAPTNEPEGGRRRSPTRNGKHPAQREAQRARPTKEAEEDQRHGNRPDKRNARGHRMWPSQAGGTRHTRTARPATHALAPHAERPDTREGERTEGEDDEVGRA